jgi:hypothetical protein
MSRPPDRTPANMWELGGWARKETKHVVAYEAEARAERERVLSAFWVPPVQREPEDSA